MAQPGTHTTTKTTYRTEKNIKLVPTTRLNFRLVDREFDSKPDRMQAEIQRMEQEMEKLRKEFWGGGGFPGAMPPFGSGDNTSSSTRQVTSITRTSRSTQGSEMGKDFPAHDFSADFPSRDLTSSMPPMVTSMGGGDMSSWILGSQNSPLVREGEDGKELKLRFDVSEYQPEELEVKTIDNKLQVHAKHEENTENRKVFREFHKEFLLPKNVDPESLKSSLSADGILTVDAPLALPAPREHAVPIAQA